MTKEKLRRIIGENIKKERRVRDMTIDDLAELLGLTPGFVGLIERGARGASSLVIWNLADIFGLPTDSFFYGSNKETLSIRASENPETDIGRLKIYSLLASFTVNELNFIISMVKGLPDLKHPSVRL